MILISINIALALLIVVSIVGCKSEPKMMFVEPRKVSIAYLKSFYAGYPLSITEDISVEGILISSDSQGNFQKSLVLQDNTGGIEVKIDMKNIFLYYHVGNRYRVHCNGLMLGSYGGTLQLGYPSASPNYQVEWIPSGKVSSHITKLSNDQVEVMPTMTNIADLSMRYVGCWVGIERVQFIDQELDLAWSDGIESSGERHLIDINGDTLRLYTSPDAYYAQQRLPSGSGRVEGILGYFNKQYQMRLTTLYYVIMDLPRFIPRQSRCLATEPPTTYP